MPTPQGRSGQRTPRRRPGPGVGPVRSRCRSGWPSAPPGRCGCMRCPPRRGGGWACPPQAGEQVLSREHVLVDVLLADDGREQVTVEGILELGEAADALALAEQRGPASTADGGHGRRVEHGRLRVRRGRRLDGLHRGLASRRRRPSGSPSRPAWLDGAAARPRPGRRRGSTARRSSGAAWSSWAMRGLAGLDGELARPGAAHLLDVRAVRQRVVEALACAAWVSARLSMPASSR